MNKQVFRDLSEMTSMKTKVYMYIHPCNHVCTYILGCVKVREIGWSGTEISVTTHSNLEQKHRNTEHQKHRSTETQEHRNMETKKPLKPSNTETQTQKHRNTETQKHRNTKAQEHGITETMATGQQ